MKKRIIAAFISMVIVALSVLTVFSGCSGEEGVKEVENREAFFSEIEGVYIDCNNYSDRAIVQIMEDGSFLICYTFFNMYVDGYYCSNETIYLKGYFQTVYNDDEVSYHSTISKLTPLVRISSAVSSGQSTIKYDIKFNPRNDLLDDFVYFSSSEDICSNDMFKIFFPGAPTAYIPVIDESDTKPIIDNEKNDYDIYGNGYYYDKEQYEDIYDYDKNNDDLLDYYLLSDDNIEHTFKPIKTNYLIENGIWIDYTSEAPAVKVYDCKNNSVKVTRYSLSNDSVTKLESEENNADPYFYTALSNSIIMINDNEEKYLTLRSTNDENKLMVSADNSNSAEIKKDYSLYHYDKLPEYETLVRDATKAKTEFAKNN